MHTLKKAHSRKYHAVKDYIKGRIIAGQYKPGDRIESEDALTKIMGLSRSSVREGLSELEFEGVIDIVHGKGTFIREKKTAAGTIAYVFSRVESEAYDNPYYGGVFAGVEEEAKRTGINIQYRSYGRQEILDASAVPHVFDLPSIFVSFFPRSFIERALASQIPFATIDILHEGLSFPSVVSDCFAMARDAVRYLISKGHRRIAHVAGNLLEYSGTERLAGYKAALQEHDIEFDERLVFEGAFTWESGYHAAKLMYPRLKEFSAVYFSGDTMALAAMQYFYKMGVRIPDDVSIIGNDDIAASSQPLYSLTTMRIDTREMGCAAYGLLKERMNGGTAMPVVRIPGTLIERATVKTL
ncbi:MAG: GntR family transcriptional regulator [Spirochaetes bacterium]|nr:GntR family transcriptional regulator [Spirochaetota bacterium]